MKPADRLERTKPMSDSIAVNIATIDYITLTTYVSERYEQWQNDLTEPKDWLGTKDSRFENYAGIQTNLKDGSLFMGEGIQRNASHYLIYATSYLAELLYKDMVKKIPVEGANDYRATRVDLQITVLHPTGYNPWELMERQYKKGRLVTTDASRDVKTGRELRTVYIGAKGGDKLVRVYQKQDLANDLYLRFEVQYRNNKAGGRAESLFKSILKDESVKAETLVWELQLLGDPIADWFMGALHGFKAKAIKTTYTKSMATREWFIRQVLPALNRYLSEQQDIDLMLLFYSALNGNEDGHGWVSSDE